MGGRVLWLESCQYIQIIEKIVGQLCTNKKIKIDDVRKIFEPIIWQAALHEQHAIMRKMEQAGLSKVEIANMLKYSRDTVEEILSLDWESEYDYDQFGELRSFSLEVI